MKIIAAGRDEEAGASLIKEIGSNALFVKTDVSNAKSVEELFKKAKAQFGGIDCAFNNAGIEGELGHLDQISEEAWDRIMAINVKGVWLCLKQEIEELKRRGGGAIVNTSTNITKFGLPFTGAYTASKAAVTALTQVAAVENGKYGIRVNSVSPGAVITPMIDRIYNKEQIEQLGKSNPLGYVPNPKEIAQVVLFLLSPTASHINGESIFVDGGASLQL